MRSHQVTAAYTVELDLGLQAVFQPGQAATGPTYDCGGEPGYEDTVEDVEITKMVFGHYNGAKIAYTDILAGVDRSNPEIQKLLANLIAVLGADVEETLIQAAQD